MIILVRTTRTGTIRLNGMAKSRLTPKAKQYESKRDSRPVCPTTTTGSYSPASKTNMRIETGLCVGYSGNVDFGGPKLRNCGLTVSTWIHNAWTYPERSPNLGLSSFAEN
jgi:hypothetical protein